MAKYLSQVLRPVGLEQYFTKSSVGPKKILVLPVPSSENSIFNLYFYIM